MKNIPETEALKIESKNTGNPRASLVTLGCPMNQVDSERIMNALLARGYELVPEERADVIVVNTCGFIDSAREESIESILSVSEYRETGNLKALIVAGCLAERYRAELERDLGEADAVVGLTDSFRIPDLCDQLLGRYSTNYLLNRKTKLGYLHSAYLKIAEGCDNRCSYCAIPSIRGRFRSMSQNEILNEARELAELGIRELVLVGQDTTRYGYREGKSLAYLLEKLSEIQEIAWIRIMYAYPEHIDSSLIDAMASIPVVVPYIDMPIQHISSRVLAAMGRPADPGRIRDIIAELRNRIPGVVLRTTLMTGFPGETGKDFEELHRFVRETRFQRLGVFCYSPEEGTRAYTLPDHVSKEIADIRAEALMKSQEEITAAFQAGLVGREFEMIVDEYDPETGTAAGRTYHDAPEIDCTVRVTGGISEGQPFAKVRITSSEGFDLTGEVKPWHSR